MKALTKGLPMVKWVSASLLMAKPWSILEIPSCTRSEWQNMEPCDVLMIPIGGKIAGNTMDELDALKAVKLMHPKLVIPTHYNCGAMFNSCYNPADDANV